MVTMENTLMLREKKELYFSKTGIAIGLLAGVTWAANGVFLEIGYGHAPFTVITGVVMGGLVGAALNDFLTAVWITLNTARQGKLVEIGRALGTRPGRLVILCGLLGGPVAMSGYLLGIIYAGSAYTLPITACYPALSTVLAAIFLKEKITRNAVVGIALCILGSVIISYTPPEGGANPQFYLGVMFCLLAVIGWALEVVAAAYGIDLIDPDIAINIRSATSALVYVCVIIPILGSEAIGFLGQSLHSEATPYFIISAIMGGTSIICWYRAIDRTGAARGTILTITYTFWAVLFGVVFMGNTLTVNLAGGAFSIVLGIVFISANPRELLNLRKM